MPFDPQALALAAVLTTAGTVAFAPLVTGFISLMNTLNIPGIAGNETRVAAIVSAVIAVLGTVSAIQSGNLSLGLDGLFVAFTSWYALTTLATSIYDDLKGKASSTRAKLVVGSTSGDGRG